MRSEDFRQAIFTACWRSIGRRKASANDCLGHMTGDGGKHLLDAGALIGRRVGVGQESGVHAVSLVLASAAMMAGCRGCFRTRLAFENWVLKTD